MISIAQLKESSKSPTDFFNTLNVSKNQNNENINVLIEKFCVSEKFDIYSFAVEAIKNGYDYFIIFEILRDVIPQIETNISSLVSYLQIMHKHMQVTLNISELYQFAEKLTENSPEIAKKLLNMLLDIDNAFITNFLTSIIKNIEPEKNLKDRIDWYIQLLENENIYVKQAMIIALGSINFGSENSDEVNHVVAILDSLQKEGDELYAEPLCISFLQMIELSPEIQTRLSKLQQSNIPNVNFQISEYLQRNNKTLLSELWFRKLYLLLCAVPSDHKRILQNIDLSFYAILDNKKYKYLFEKFLKSWIEKSDYQEKAVELSDIFPHSLSKIINHEKFLSRIVTKYFANGNPKINSAGAQLIRFWKLHSNKPKYFNKDILNTLSCDNILLLVSNMIGYLYDVNIVFDLTISLFTVVNKYEKVNDFINEVMINHLGVDYLSTTIRLIEKKAKEPKLKKSVKNLLENILRKLKRKQAIYNSLPQLKELEMPFRIINLIKVEQRNDMTKLMERVKEQSIFLQMSTQVPIKYGKKWFNKTENGYCNPTELKSFKASVEIALSDVCHPVSKDLERAELRSQGNVPE